MRLQALPGPCNTTKGFSATTTMGKAIRVLRLDSQGPGALTCGGEDVHDMDFNLFPHPDRQGEEDVQSLNHVRLPRCERLAA